MEDMEDSDISEILSFMDTQRAAKIVRTLYLAVQWDTEGVAKILQVMDPDFVKNILIAMNFARPISEMLQYFGVNEVRVARKKNVKKWSRRRR